MENIPENENRYDDLEQLLAESSPRARASAEVESAVRAAVRSEWETMITKRRHQRLAGVSRSRIHEQFERRGRDLGMVGQMKEYVSCGVQTLRGA